MASDKNILLISYYFPPLGMGGVGRSYALYKYLPEFGYNVTVLTVRNILYPEHDFSLLDSEDEKSIIRSGSMDPSRILYRAGKRKGVSAGSGRSKAAFFYYPDSKRGWVPFALHKAKEIVKDRRIDVVITTSPPPSAHLVGIKLKAAFGIPWVADFRDLWFSLPIESVYPTRFQIKYARNLKERIVHSADSIVAVNNSIRDYLGRGEVIMNGADADIAGEWKRGAAGDKDRFVIGILGTINELCPVEPLLEAVAGILPENPDLSRRLRIVHVGHCDLKVSSNLVSKYSLSDIVTLRGYLPKKEAISSLASVDLLYLSVNRFDNHDILPGRIFDYLVSGKPILGVVPTNSDAAALLGEYNFGKTVEPEQTTETADYILSLYESKMTNNRKADECKIDISKFSTRTMAEKYAELLGKIMK